VITTYWSRVRCADAEPDQRDHAVLLLRRRCGVMMRRGQPEVRPGERKRDLILASLAVIAVRDYAGG
jgi:hypothetical protein